MWAVTRNETILQSLYDFCGFQPDDNLLDAACGTGAFANFAAKKVAKVNGVDISPQMIAIARKQAETEGLTNVHFECKDVETLPFEDNCFTSVISKSALHHMAGYRKVFGEMVRCCEKGGRVCLEDIILYDNEKADAFFEKVERMIDGSHHISLSKLQVFNLYKDHNLKIVRMYESESKLDFNDYVAHAKQSPNNRQTIDRMLKEALNNDQLSFYLPMSNHRVYWRRKVVSIVGYK
jgi:ubiquinone/menaquinone biosynthesis C-methylase UbiE